MLKEVALREELKFRLRVLGHSLTSIAAELDVTVAAVSNCCAGVTKSKRIQGVIADRLNVDPATIWPARYPLTKDNPYETQRKEAQVIKKSGIP